MMNKLRYLILQKKEAIISKQILNSNYSDLL
jgi:hypothetical protein